MAGILNAHISAAARGTFILALARRSLTSTPARHSGGKRWCQRGESAPPPGFAALRHGAPVGHSLADASF